MKKGKIHIGTSGWHYKHWKGTYYPADIKEPEQFAYYIRHFNTVEINNSFYMLPSVKTFRAWKDAAPKGFLFAVKASRFITHMKKLKTDAASIRSFFTRAGKLEEKLGPVLFQLPPKWKINKERLAEFLSRLPKGNLYTFEFRDHSWYHKDIYELLKKYNCAFCIYELEYHLSPVEVTADFVYIRLHGPGNKYQGSYTDATLKKWAKQCTQWQKNKKDVYVYFDNDQAGFAAFNAERLAALIGKTGNTNKRSSRKK
jgi:uncharacterized protein YecE (DUF72 family)